MPILTWFLMGFFGGLGLWIAKAILSFIGSLLARAGDKA